MSTHPDDMAREERLREVEREESFDWCRAISQTGIFYCSLREGHSGPHSFATGLRVDKHPEFRREEQETERIQERADFLVAEYHMDPSEAMSKAAHETATGELWEEQRASGS